VTKTPAAQLEAEIAEALAVPKKAKRRRYSSGQLDLIATAFDAAASLIDRFAVDGVDVPRSVVETDTRDPQAMLAAVIYVADVVGRDDADRLVKKFWSAYDLLERLVPSRSRRR